MKRGYHLVKLVCGENTAGGNMRYKARGFIPGFIVFLGFLLIVFFVPSLRAQPFILPKEIPYDPNLEITFKGRILKIYLPPRGLAALEVEREGKAYTVFLCPVSYYRFLKPDFKEGDRVEITGAKTFFPRYGIIFMARHIKNLDTGSLYLFRSPVPPYKPVWE